uniref:Uncharacterized protein n=1 Tax=Avena sativa TaxID=4498 RepID=A0ACD6AT44_AVESA
MEHDAYCMFENLMNGLVNGEQGVVAITDFYSLSPAPESSAGLSPVREASSAIYHLLASVDSSLHSHLVELGVEPQYFTLRWLRVLFGREFSLDNLLFIWDEIFSSPNHSYCTEIKSREDYQFKVLCSPRGALILSMAVSMMLHLRSSLLGSEHATSCLVRLLNFPDDIDLKNLIEKAKLLQYFALEKNLPSSPLTGKSPLSPTNYWEETWKTLQMSGDKRSGGPTVRMKGRGLLRRSVSNTESNGSRTKDANFENSNLTSASQSIVDEPHNTDIVPVNLMNSLPSMPTEHQKDHVGQGTAEIIRSTSNSLGWLGLRDGDYTTPVETRNRIEAAREYVSSKMRPSFPRRRNASDLDTRNAEQPCVSHDAKVLNEPDPLSVHNSRIAEPDQANDVVSNEERRDVGLLEKVIDNMKLGLHPLELYHQSVIYTVPQNHRYYYQGSRLSEYQEDIMPSAMEMHGAGIKFRTSMTNSLVDVHFRTTMLRWSRVLTMPRVTVDDSTEYLYLNLMAFERLHCCFNTHVTAYVRFMDNLIESARDVALLCSKGVLKNMLGSNQELAHLFNGTLVKGALMGKYMDMDDDNPAQPMPLKTSAKFKF